MPKKTKQDKILAQLRRLQTNKSIALDPVEPAKPTVSLDLKSTNAVTKSSENTTTKVSNQDYSYVIKDLRKTSFFVVVAVVFEFILSILLKNWI